MRIHFPFRPLLRTALILTIFAVLSWPSLLTCQAPPKTLSITTIERIPLDGPGHPEDPESLYYLVSAAYPQDWQDEVEDTLKVMVDGHAVPFNGGGSGFGGGEAEGTFWVYLGAPGKKKIEVTLLHLGKTVRAEKMFIVTPQPVLRPLDHYDGEGVFQNEPLRFLACSVKDATVKVNGKDVPPDSKPVEGFESISILTIPPSLQPGKNSIEYSGVDPDGKRFSHSVALFFAADNKLKAGDRFLLTYGAPKSKSGPFYYVAPDGDVLVSGGDVQWKSIVAQGKAGWFNSHEVFSFPITAKTAGDGEIALSIKSNFLMNEELDKTLKITVEP